MTTPWPAMLRLAAERLRIAPDAFWRLSLAEWRALTREDGPLALDRAGFDALLRHYPD
ncbi:MAG: phage tail assembly chaperone [Caulobacter sp.]|nr:phage tail assembly chaperone [Caulobacter sp.]